MTAVAKKVDKQNLFAKEYVVDYNGTQAAIRAGYSEKSARTTACRLLKNPKILDKIKQNQKELIEKSCLTEEKILNKLEIMLDRCMSAEPVMEWDYEEHDYVKTGEYQFDSKGALKAIELLGKHLGMFNKNDGSRPEDNDDGFLEALQSKAGELEWQE